MEWFRSEFFLQVVLPGGLCALIAWICMVDRFRAKGRMLGSWRSALLAVTVAALLSAVAVVVNVFLLPLAPHIPAAAVAFVGAAVSRRGRPQQETVTPVTAGLSLGITLLLTRLEERLEADRADWCDRMMLGLDDHWKMQIFADAVKRHLALRAEGKQRRLKAIETRYQELCEAFEHFIEEKKDVDLACEEGTRGWRRPRTDEERRRLLRARGEMEERCKLLLRLAHEYGRRTDERALHELKRRSILGDEREVPVRQNA